MRSNSITKILKEDRDFSKAELASFPTDSFLEIDKCASKLDYEDLSELSAKALEITGERENSVYARYVLGTIAFIRRPHEDNIIMQNLLISFYDNHNWTVVEFLCRKILSYSENKLALRILADCMRKKAVMRRDGAYSKGSSRSTSRKRRSQRTLQIISWKRETRTRPSSITAVR